MYDSIPADINPNVTAVTYNVTRLHCICAYAIPYASQCAGGMGKPYAKCCIYAHYKPGAVCAVCQTCPAIYIRVTHKLACIVCNCLPTSAAWRSIAPAFP